MALCLSCQRSVCQFGAFAGNDGRWQDTVQHTKDGYLIQCGRHAGKKESFDRATL
jgi:hypothetical protein